MEARSCCWRGCRVIPPSSFLCRRFSRAQQRHRCLQLKRNNRQHPRKMKPTWPSIALPSGFQILASPSAEDDSKEGGERIHERLETAAECPFQASWKPEEGTAKLYPPAASFVAPVFARLADIADAIAIEKHAKMVLFSALAPRHAVEAYLIRPLYAHGTQFRRSFPRKARR